MNATAQHFDPTLPEFVLRHGGRLDLQLKLVGFVAVILSER